MSALIALVAVMGGATVWLFGDNFESLGAAIWWSFLRLTDPGYLGDDEGLLLRVVSTVVTVLGYVLFMGSLIAIMTQWLARTMRQLESGTTPIAINGHILILGWSNRTPEIIQQLLSSSGRLKRFLRSKNSDSLKIVVLAETVSLELTEYLRARIGRRKSDKHVIFRSGSSLKSEHLRRVDLGHSAAVIVPGADFEAGGWELRDTRIIKTLMSVKRFVEETPAEIAPTVVAELAERARIRLARRTMPEHLEIVTGSDVAGSIVSQIIKNPGISEAYDHLISHEKAESLYLKHLPELAGKMLADCLLAFPRALPVGVVRPEEGAQGVFLNRLDTSLQSSDLLVLVADAYDACEPEGQGNALTGPFDARLARDESHRKVLVLGWSHKLFALLRELGGSGCAHLQIDLLSRVSESARRKAFQQFGPVPRADDLTHFVGDYTADSTLQGIELGAYDSIVFLASDNMETAEQADARTILGYALVKDLLASQSAKPQLLLELMDGENAHLFDREEAEVVVSPRVMSHLLAQTAMRPELASVYQALFGADGPDIVLKNPTVFGLASGAGREAIIQAAAVYGQLPLAILADTPPGKASRLSFLTGDDRNRVLINGDQLVCLAPTTA